MTRLGFLLLICLQFSAYATGRAQGMKVSLDMHNVTLEQVLKELKAQTGMRFFYSVEKARGEQKEVVKMTDISLEEALRQVLDGTKLTYEIQQDVIVIREQQEQQQSPKERKITGKVTDEEGMPLPGVTVLIKGTQLGTATDGDGNYQLTVPAQGHALVFTMVGMETREETIGERSEINVTMVADVNEMKEVVVTGYGNKSIASFTGAAQTVTKDQLLRAGTKNILSSLQAFVPGMLLVTNNARGSDPNTRPEILVRGRSSFTSGSSMPTFIVDGAEVSADYVFDMDINDVESATVLKDASASALYGAKAANGVIVITTRPMKAGKMKVSYSGNFSLTVPDLSDYHLLNAEEKLEYEYLAGLYTSQEGLSDEQYSMDERYNEIYQRIREGVNTDWLSYPLRNAFVNNHNVTVYGGDHYVRYNLGVRYGNDRGVMKDSERKRYSLSFKLSYSKDDLIFIQNYATITSVNNVESPYGSFSQYVEQNPYDRAYNLDGSLNNDLTYGKLNPLYEASLGSYNKGENFSINDVFDIKVQLLEGLRLEGSFSLTKYKNNTEVFLSPDSKEFNDVPASEAGSITLSNSNSIDYQGKLLLTYNKMFGEGTLLSLIAGGNLQSSNSNSNGYTGIGIFSDRLAHPSFASQYPSESSPTGSQDISRSLGGFINVNTIYKDRYFADFSIRYEGSSKFGSDQRYAPFWSVGVGWNIHKEKFFNAAPTDRLKLRASVGYLGNASFSPYQAITTYEYNSDYVYDNGIGATPITIGNPDLKWERTLNWNVGLDVNLFNNRLDMTIDYYKKITDNLLLSVTKAPSVGVGEATENIGKIDNTGIEFRTRVIALRNQDWDWSLSLTASHNKNKIRQISNSLKAQNEKNNAEKSRQPQPVYEEGQSISAIKAVQSGGIDPATGKEVYIGKDGRPTFTYDYNDKIVFGDSDPKVYG
ncbi:MAG TPA: SusC/RagA family TonB-linked outer membrane protein, partial [Candidatus Odoribacter faecigallinarum]|nr:SusC/RagA family TonB-linked outer membrane protein [Candidatus Odoribacter faecigallinarum]